MEITKEITPYFLSGGGEMGELIRTMDWSKSLLGKPEHWPQNLRTAVSICINSRFPMVIWWGSHLIKIYNDGYRNLIAAKHPKAMGARGEDIWPEIWPVVGPMLQSVLDTGVATWSEDQMLLVERNGYPEESYFTFSYSAICDESGAIGGVFCAVNETTKRVLSERHLAKQVNNLFTQAPIAICIFRGNNFVVEMVNERMLQFWGRKAEQVVDKPVFESMPDLGGQGFEELLDKVYNTGERFVTSEISLTILRNINSEKVFIKLVYEALRDEDGSISGVMAVADEITDQVLLRKKIEESNTRYNRLLMGSPFAFCIMKGKDQVITLANNVMKEFWGKGNEVEGKTLLQVLPELKDQPFPGMIDSVYSTGNPVYANEIMAHLKRNGNLEERYFNIIYQPHVEADETISGVITIAHEVTNQVISRKKIEESEAFNRTVLESSPDCLKIIDADGRLLFMNNNGLCNLEIGDFSQFKNEPWWNLWATENQQLVKEAVAKALTGETAFFQALGYTTKGTAKWWDVIVSPVLEEGVDKKVSRIISVSRDITIQKQAAIKLQQSEQRFRNLVEKAPSPIYILKGESMILEVANDPVFKVWNVGKEALGKPFLDIIPEMKDQPFMRYLLDVYRNGVTHYGFEEPAYFNRENGETVLAYFNFTYQPYQEDDGTISGVMVLATDVTEQVISRKKIEESEHRYQKMIYSSPSMIAILRGEELIIDIANDAILETWGKGKDVIGKPLLSILPELIDQGFYDLFHQVYTTGQPDYGYEIPVQVMRNGQSELSYYTFVYQAQRDINDKICGIAIIATEVTPQAELNKKIKYSEERFRLLVRQAPVAICVLRGTNYVIEIINEAMAEIWGRTIDESINKPAFDVLPEFRDQGLKELLDTVYTTGVPFVAQELPLAIMRREMLENIFIKFVYEPIREADGSITGVMALAHEITDQVMARKRIEESEAHYRQMADLMPAKITNASPDGFVTYYNKNWLDFTGKTFEELKGFGFHNIIHPDEIEKFQQLFTIAAEMGTQLEMEMRFLNKAGEYIWHLNLASPVKDENGKVKMWVGSTTEIQKMKDEEERKDNFIKMVSHELKTPVTSIKGYVQLLLTMLQDEQEALLASLPVKTFLVRIDKLVLRLSKLITELLDLSRIEAGRLELKNELFNLNDLMNDAVEDIRFTNPKHGIKIYQDFNCTINGDRGRIEQAAINVITNAIKYSVNNDSIILRIYKADNNYVAVSVQDFGIGIDKKDHEKIFERFYRVGGKSEETYPGFGIGLFIVKEILSQHHGFITVESEKGKGTVFTFTLPFVTQNKAEEIKLN